MRIFPHSYITRLVLYVRNNYTSKLRVTSEITRPKSVSTIITNSVNNQFFYANKEPNLCDFLKILLRCTRYCSLSFFVLKLYFFCFLQLIVRGIALVNIY